MESRVSAVRARPTAYRNETETEKLFLEPSRMSSRALFTRINETRPGDTREIRYSKKRKYLFIRAHRYKNRENLSLLVSLFVSDIMIFERFER